MRPPPNYTSHSSSTPYHEVQHNPQSNQSQEDTPTPLYRRWERRNVRSIQHSLRLTDLRLTHLTHLIVDQALRDNHADGCPEVLAQSLVRGVVEEVVGLTNGRQGQQSPNHQTDHHQRVLWMKWGSEANAGRNPQAGLEEEGVHLSDLKDDADESGLHETLERPENVPVVVLPATHHTGQLKLPHWRELLQEALCLTSVGFNFGEAYPVVFTCLELPVDPHADAHAEEVASENICD